MPFPGCAEKLGAAFGLRFNNGFAFETEQEEIVGEGWLTFSRSDESLGNHAITHGRSVGEGIDSVMSFTGQAFQSDVNVRPLLTIGADVVSFMPERAWEFHYTTPQIPVEGWLQGAVLSLGSGRIAAFGEAAMFSAQIRDGSPMGMNAPGAEQNFQFVLNVMHWLSGLLDTFVDVAPGSNHDESICAIYYAGITTGCAQNPLRFCPQDPVTRAQMAAFIIRALEGEPTTDCDPKHNPPFPDVNPILPVCKYIKRLSELEITTG
jgi:hypothetical protein